MILVLTKNLARQGSARNVHQISSQQCLVLSVINRTAKKKKVKTKNFSHKHDKNLASNAARATWVATRRPEITSWGCKLLWINLSLSLETQNKIKEKLETLNEQTWSTLLPWHRHLSFHHQQHCPESWKYSPEPEQTINITFLNQKQQKRKNTRRPK